MRSVWTSILLCSAVLCPASGCIFGEPADHFEPGQATVTREGLQAELFVDRRSATVGDVIHLTFTARNVQREASRIESATANPLIVTLWRYDAAKDWIRLEEFPAAPLRQHQSWLLDGGDDRTFSVELPIGPHWPALETLKLSAELNGRPDVRPHVFLYVHPK